MPSRYWPEVSALASGGRHGGELTFARSVLMWAAERVGRSGLALSEAQLLHAALRIEIEPSAVAGRLGQLAAARLWQEAHQVARAALGWATWAWPWSPGAGSGHADTRAADRPVALTTREREMAVQAAGGLTNRMIADRLAVSVRTVENHLQTAYAKLGVNRWDDLGPAIGLDRAQPEAVPA